MHVLTSWMSERQKEKTGRNIGAFFKEIYNPEFAFSVRDTSFVVFRHEAIISVPLSFGRAAGAKAQSRNDSDRNERGCRTERRKSFNGTVLRRCTRETT